MITGQEQQGIFARIDGLKDRVTLNRCSPNHRLFEVSQA
jgi:hypothetical protein